MIQEKIYQPLIDQLTAVFKDRLKAVVLFGSRSRGKVRDDRDHDIFMIIEDLPENPIMRQKKVRTAIWDLGLRINTIAKTPEEVESNLTPLLLEISIDGICLYGNEYFEPYRIKALRALEQSGLKRKRIGREWYWNFDRVPRREWEMTWEGFRELE